LFVALRAFVTFQTSASAKSDATAATSELSSERVASLVFQDGTPPQPTCQELCAALAAAMTARQSAPATLTAANSSLADLQDRGPDLRDRHPAGV